MDYYMQRSTYKHDYSKGGGANRGRSMNYPPNVAPPADINPPAEFYRAPARLDPGDHLARDLERLDFDDRTPRTERRRPVKRGEEWVPGRRYENYDEPQTDRGYYRSPERNGYEQERGRNASPDRVHYDRGKRRDDEQQRYNDQDRVRHTSMDRHYDRDFSPQRSLQRYERPRDLDAFANQGRFIDRTTYKDYGEFMGSRMRDEERKRMTMEQLAANQREMHTHREAYRNQMFGTDRENRFNLKVRKPNDESKDRNDDVQIKHATDRVELHPGNFKPWVYQRPLYESTAHHDGVYLFIRANKSGRDKIIHALKRNRTVLGISGGKLKGIAEPSQIKLLEGRHGWNINAPLTRKGDFWAERHDNVQLVNDMILVFRFQHTNDAEAWLRTEPHIKQAYFPDPDRADIFYEREKCADEIGYDTFLMSEYPKILTQEFAHNFAPRILKVIRRRGAIGEDHFMGMPHGVTLMRGLWVNPKSIFTCLRFRNEREAWEFYFDGEMQEIILDMRRYVEIHQRNNPDVFPITTVLFTLHELP